LDLLVGGWQYSCFAGFHSGTPYSVNINADIANIGNSGYERPNIVDSTSLAHKIIKNWLNPSGFAVPAEFTYGNMGRDALRTGFSKDVDMAVFKKVRLGERYKAKFTTDAFNILNYPTWGQPDSTLGDQNFGVIGSASEQRTVQLSGRVTF
jgi:hypothetical protein